MHHITSAEFNFWPETSEPYIVEQKGNVELNALGKRTGIDRMCIYRAGVMSVQDWRSTSVRRKEPQGWRAQDKIG